MRLLKRLAYIGGISAGMGMGGLILMVTLSRLNYHYVVYGESGSGEIHILQEPLSIDDEMMQGLPNPGWIGTVGEQFQSGWDRLWLLSAPDDVERGRRMLWLANRRLRGSCELLREGNVEDGVWAMQRAVGYLEQVKAMDVMHEGQAGWEEWEWSVQRHSEVLGNFEGKVNDEVKVEIEKLMDRVAILG